MTVEIVANQHRQVAIDRVTPAAQLSANADAIVVGSEIDARAWNSMSYTLVVADNSVTWTVFGGNATDYSDEQVVKAATAVAAGASDTYAMAPVTYAYYRVKIRSTVGGAHGTATVRGIAKG